MLGFLRGEADNSSFIGGQPSFLAQKCELLRRLVVLEQTRRQNGLFISGSEEFVIR